MVHPRTEDADGDEFDQLFAPGRDPRRGAAIADGCEECLQSGRGTLRDVAARANDVALIMPLLERDAVVVIPSLTGYRDTPPFATDDGRMCVAPSRHRAHATVVVDTHTDTVLRHASTRT
jgi:hypothetical protein